MRHIIYAIFTALALCGWAQVAPLTTPWGESIDPANTHNEYPRPQLKRGSWLNLNGKWDYAITAKDAPKPKAFEGKINVPFAIESALSGVQRTVGADSALWYSRSFVVPADWKGKDVMLNFGGVDWDCSVWVNGHEVGGHKGAYVPFAINISRALKKGENNVTVRVWDPTDEGTQPRGKQVKKPKGIWYTPVTGIWQTVWLEPVDRRNHIEALRITPDIDAGTLTVRASTLASKGTVNVVVKDGGTTVAQAGGESGNDIVLTMPGDFKLWSPDSPALYDVEVSLNQGGKDIDNVRSYAAMRKVSTVRDSAGTVRLALNNEPLFHFGPLDQGWWPDGLYTAPSHQAMIYDIDMTKELGFNMIRKHIKVEPATWYAHCDSVGMLVWQDMPSGDRTDQWQRTAWYRGEEADRTPESAGQYYREWEAIMDHLHNFPCIAVWVPFNEAWGQFRTVEVTDWTKRHDPSRLVNSASGGNFFHCGDIIDMHHYPEPKIVVTDPERANVLGEYGGIGWAAPGHLWSPNRNWGYVKFNSSAEVTEQYLKFINMLAEQAAQIYGGAVYTQTTDVENEVNGLMTYDRKLVKVDLPKVAEANRRLIKANSGK